MSDASVEDVMSKAKTSFGDFCLFKLCRILSHGVSDFGLVIWVDFFQVISELGRHRREFQRDGRQFYTCI